MKKEDDFFLSYALGKPAFIITMTSNPEWPEFRGFCGNNKDNWILIPQNVCQIFNEKVNQMMKILRKRKKSLEKFENWNSLYLFSNFSLEDSRMFTLLLDIKNIFLKNKLEMKDLI